MYDRNDLRIKGNEILVKDYTGDLNNDGVRYFNWETLLEVNESKCLSGLWLTMSDLLETFVN